LLFGEALFFILFFPVWAKNAAPFQFGTFRFCRDDIALLRVANDLRFVSAASECREVG
jgi:hypothetical protein